MFVARNVSCVGRPKKYLSVRPTIYLGLWFEKPLLLSVCLVSGPARKKIANVNEDVVDDDNAMARWVMMRHQ